VRSGASQGGVPADPTLARDFRFCYHCKLGSTQVLRRSIEAAAFTGTFERLMVPFRSADSALRVFDLAGIKLIGDSPAGQPVFDVLQYIAFSARQHEKALLYVMQADGTNARIVADSLQLQGAPA
jgi:hypothetical protein